MFVRHFDQASSSSLIPNYGWTHGSDEATPLLQQTSSEPPSAENESERTGALIEAAALVDGPGLEPGQPAELTKTSSYSSDKAVSDVTGSGNEHRSSQPAAKGSPYLCGVSKRRFWVLYAGVLLQYFVRDW